MLTCHSQVDVLTWRNVSYGRGLSAVEIALGSTSSSFSRKRRFALRELASTLFLESISAWDYVIGDAESTTELSHNLVFFGQR